MALNRYFYKMWWFYEQSFRQFTKEEFKDTKAVIRIRKSKDRQDNGQKEKKKTIYKTYI